ncbi:MAG: hypothetical protein RIC55_21440 [Pirellulaceae bacterium]
MNRPTRHLVKPTQGVTLATGENPMMMQHNRRQRRRRALQGLVGHTGGVNLQRRLDCHTTRCNRQQGVCVVAVQQQRIGTVQQRLNHAVTSSSIGTP